ncbi:unnamed protein product, partial [Staurois parvus]
MCHFRVSSHCCQVQKCVSWVSCTASHCCWTSSPDSAMCHFQVSLHCVWWVPFCDRVLLLCLPLLLPSDRHP